MYARHSACRAALSVECAPQTLKVSLSYSSMTVTVGDSQNLRCERIYVRIKVVANCVLLVLFFVFFFFFSSRRRHTRSDRDWSSDVCSSDLHSPRADGACPWLTGGAYDAKVVAAHGRAGVSVQAPGAGGNWMPRRA